MTACELADNLRFSGGGIDTWSRKLSAIVVDPLRALISD